MVGAVLVFMLIGGIAERAWITVGLFVVIFGTTAYRLATLRVIASDEDLVIRNAWWTHIVGWDEIDRFAVGTTRQGVFKFPHTGVALLRDGRDVPMHGVAAANISGPRDRPALERVVDQLNDELADHRGA